MVGDGDESVSIFGSADGPDPRQYCKGCEGSTSTFLMSGKNPRLLSSVIVEDIMRERDSPERKYIVAGSKVWREKSRNP